jgi:hypothetical protein
MRDIASRPLIVGKGLLLLGLAGATAILIYLAMPGWRTAALLTVLIWASCRSYYFLFYVLHRYVDPDLRYAGLLSLLGQIRRSAARGGAPPGGMPRGGAGPSSAGDR